ncbi:MAG TPA: hypothetical protein VIH90_06745 [Candidatus Saccharimonadales bacterium]
MPEWKVSTPIDTFEHPETGSQIDLVSVVHVGTPSYYRKLGSYIMGRQDDGFTVHYETIASSDETIEPTTPLEAIKQRVHEAKTDASADSYVSVIVHSGYTIQENSDLFHDANSENHDITEAEYVGQSGLLTLARGLIGERRLRRKLEKTADKGSEAMDEFVFGVIKQGVDKATSDKQRNKRHDKVTIQVRNQVALEGVDTALVDDPAAKLVLIWGVGHLAGLQSGLIGRGYEHTSRQETEIAVNRAQLKRDIQKHEVALRRQQAKVDRHRTVALGITGRREQTLTQFERDRLARQKETQKWLDESRQRSAELMQRLERERKQREQRIFGTPLVDDKKQGRRYLPWFSAK